jgi:predicted fused transcriptional regulator/phosphomethylpyrimidine kinase
MNIKGVCLEGRLVSQEKEKKIVTGPKYGRSVYMYEYRIMKTIQLYKKEG